MAKGGKRVVTKPAKKGSSKDWKSQHAVLFEKNARDFGVGRDVLPTGRDLSRLVKWPRYVRIQRQRAILKKRIKVPPAIHHLSKTLDKNQASNLFRLLSHYRPESAAEKKERLTKVAAAEDKSQDVKSGKKPKVVKFGLNHVTTLVEEQKAKLVVIAHDVDPVELVLWLPALCRKMGVPYCIVKGKARLGSLVYQKKTCCLALTEVDKADQAKLDQLISNVKPMYESNLKQWGGGIMGVKAQARVKKVLANK
jgi:large subunit ribosomal protein L7Ae